MENNATVSAVTAAELSETKRTEVNRTMALMPEGSASEEAQTCLRRGSDVAAIEATRHDEEASYRC